MWTSLVLVTVLCHPACSGKLAKVLLNNGTTKPENENTKFLGNGNDIGMDNNSNGIDTSDAVDPQTNNYIFDDLVNFDTQHLIFLNSTDTPVTTENYSEHIITKNSKLQSNEIRYIYQDAQQIQKSLTGDDETLSDFKANDTTLEERVIIGSEESSKHIHNTNSEHDLSRKIIDNSKNTYNYTKNRLAVRHILNDYYAVTNTIYEDNAVTNNPYRNLETKTHYLKNYDTEYVDTTTEREYDTTLADILFVKKNSYLAKHFNLTKTVKSILDYKDMMFDLISRFNASEAHSLLNNDSISNEISNISSLIEENNETNKAIPDYSKTTEYDVEDEKTKNNDSVHTMGFYILATENFSNNQKLIQEALNKFLNQNFTSSLKRINRKMDYFPDTFDEKEKHCENCCKDLNSDCLLDIKMRKLRAQMFDILLTIEQIKKSLTETDLTEKQSDNMKDRLRRQGNKVKNESSPIDNKSYSFQLKKLDSDKLNTYNSNLSNKDDLIISLKQVFNFLFDDKDFKQISELRQLNTSRPEPCNNSSISQGDQSEYDKTDFFDTYYNLKLLKKTLKTFGNLQHKLFRHILKAVDSIESRISSDLKLNRENHKNSDILTDGMNYSMDRKRRNISDVHEKAIRYILTLVDALLEEVHSSVISTKTLLSSTSMKPYTSVPPVAENSTINILTNKKTNSTVPKPKKTFYSFSPLLLEKNGNTKNDSTIQHVKKAAENVIVPENNLKKREELKTVLTNPLLEKRYTEKHLKKGNYTLNKTNISSTSSKTDSIDYSESLPTSVLTSSSKNNYYSSATTVESSFIKNLSKHTQILSKNFEVNTTNSYKAYTTTTVTTPGSPRYNEFSAFSELSTSGTSSKRLFPPVTLQYTKTTTIGNISPIALIKIPEKSLFDNYDAFEEKHYTAINDSVSTSQHNLKNSTSSIVISTVVSSESQIQQITNNSVYPHNMSTRPTKFYFYSNDYEAENKDHQTHEHSTIRTVITTVSKYATTQSTMKPKFFNMSHPHNINLFNDYENLEIDHYDSFNKSQDVIDPPNQDLNYIVETSERLNNTKANSSIQSEFKLFSNYDENSDIKSVSEDTDIQKMFKLNNYISNPERKSVKETTKYESNFGQPVEVVMPGPPRKTETDDFINFSYIPKVTDSSRDRAPLIMITNGYHFNSEGLLESATEESETHTVINKILHDKNAALLDALDYGDKETVRPSTTTAESDRMDIRRHELRGVTTSTKLKDLESKKVFKDPGDVALNSDSYFDEVDSEANSNDRDSDPPYPYERDNAFGVAYM